MRAEPLLGVGQRGRRVRTGRGDQHQLVRRDEHPGQAGRRRVDHGQRVPFGQQIGEPLEVMSAEGAGAAGSRRVGDHVEPGARAAAARQVGPWPPAARAPTRRSAAGGERGRARIQVERRHGSAAHRGQDVAGHQGGDGLSCAPGAAEHGNPARTGQRQPGAVAIQRLLVPLARSLTAGDHLHLASPADLTATARAAERPLDSRQRPFPLHADELGRRRRRRGAGAGAAGSAGVAGAGADGRWRGRRRRAGPAAVLARDAGMRSCGAGAGFAGAGSGPRAGSVSRGERVGAAVQQRPLPVGDGSGADSRVRGSDSLARPRRPTEGTARGASSGPWA